MVTYIGMSILSVLVLALAPFVIGRFIGSFQAGSSSGDGDAMFYLIIYGLLELVFWSLHGPSRVIEREVSLHVKTSFQLSLFSAATSFPIAWHKDHHSGEIVDRVNRAAGALGDFTDRSFETIHILTRYFGAIIGLGFFMPQVSVAMVGITILIFLSTTIYDRELVALEKQLSRLYERVSGAVHDYLSNITTVITLRLEDRASIEVRRRLTEVMPGFKRKIRVNEIKWFTNSMLIRFSIVGMVLWFWHAQTSGGQAVQLGALVSLLEYLRAVGDSFFGMSWKLGDLVAAAAKIRIGDSLLEEASVLGVRASDGKSHSTDWTNIQIKNVAFSHVDSDESRPALTGVSIELQRGRAIAVIGESGSGKSTLLSILRLLHTPTSVEVFSDGERLEAGLRFVASMSTLVPQDPEVFAETIRYNITMGISASDAEIEDAITRARFKSVLERLPKGLDTNIAEKGINLSGGEKQRLALARAIFFSKDSQVLLLDESTSSVDSVNERAIYLGLLADFSDRVVVATVHKLNLLPLFSYIYFLDGGVIAEEGTYQSLLKKNGRVAELVRSYHELNKNELE
jgi:ATP-binding cassette subfamily B protein